MKKQTVLVVLAVLVLVGLGSAFGLYVWVMEKPDQRGYAYPVEHIPAEHHEEVLKQCQTVATSDEILGKVVSDLGLAEKLEAPNNAAAIATLRERVVVELMGGKQVGFMVTGKRKERAFLEEVAQAIFKGTLETLAPPKQGE